MNGYEGQVFVRSHRANRIADRHKAMRYLAASVTKWADFKEGRDKGAGPTEIPDSRAEHTGTSTYVNRSFIEGNRTHAHTRAHDAPTHARGEGLFWY